MQYLIYTIYPISLRTLISYLLYYHVQLAVVCDSCWLQSYGPINVLIGNHTNSTNIRETPTTFIQRVVYTYKWYHSIATIYVHVENLGVWFIFY